MCRYCLATRHMSKLHQTPSLTPVASKSEEAKMRTLMLALCAGVLLSACQDTTGAQGPPPTFSPAVQAIFERYMGEINPTLFVVSTDGQYARYTYCPAYADACYPAAGATKSKALRSCEEQSGGVSCKVYALGRRVVWKGTAAPSP